MWGQGGGKGKRGGGCRGGVRGEGKKKGGEPNNTFFSRYELAQ